MGVVGLWVPFKVFTVQESRFGIWGRVCDGGYVECPDVFLGGDLDVES